MGQYGTIKIWALIACCHGVLLSGATCQGEVLQQVYAFNGVVDGSVHPEARLTQAQDGCLYGTTRYGGMWASNSPFDMEQSSE
jgi:hypothetical protein